MMFSKSELRTLLKKHGIRPNRLLGQNFLVDKNMQKKILEHCGLAGGDIVAIGEATRDNHYLVIGEALFTTN